MLYRGKEEEQKKNILLKHKSESNQLIHQHYKLHADIQVLIIFMIY